MRIKSLCVRFPAVYWILIFNFVFAQIPLYGRMAHASSQPPMYRQPTANDLHEMMGNLASSSFSELERKRMTAVIFVHQDVYRKAVIRGEFPADDEAVQAFLRAKEDLQEEVAHRMNILYRNRSGENLKAPIIPFSYNNILSDDDVVTGSGKVGQMMEGLYTDALDEVIRERAQRPMTAADRARVDVNGLSWDMTQEGALENFWHKEKYINPQSGFANQTKLSSAGDKVKVLTFDDDGRLVRLSGDEAKKAIAGLAVDRPLEIPGINLEKGSGSMSDYMRMADIHQVKFQGLASEEQIAQFIRNQKYTERVAGDFKAVALHDNPDLARQHEGFLAASDKIRKQTTMAGVAQILQDEYRIKIVDANGVVDLNKLTEAMQIHQQRQITQVMPELTGAVMRNEAYKMLQWIQGEAVNSAKRLLLRKQLALTCAALNDGQLNKIAADLEKMDVDEADKAFLRRAVVDDSHQIKRYARLMELPSEDLAKMLKIDGDNVAVVDFVISKNAKVTRLVDAMTSRPGGSRFKEFLRSKTAQALNLDVMLGESTRGEKIMSWSLLILAATRAFNAANSTEEGLKKVGMVMFEMIPFVASALRFSEGEFKESFKEFCLDVLPPLALANVAFMALNYAGETVKEAWKETVWEGLVREALRDLNDEDFEKTETGYYRLENRAGYLEFLEDVAPGMGRVAKLASMVEPEVEARMSRDSDVKNNNAALYTLQYLEEIDLYLLRVRYAKQFDLEQIKNRVWEKGMPPSGAASPVERVAAKIILDNLSVRARIYTEVLESFIDRIERRYNELKGEMEEDFDPSAIIAETMAILKRDFENAPQDIKDSPWGMERLEEGYRERIAYLKDYTGEGKDELAVRQEMQQIIEDFRKFIAEVALGVSLYEEMQSLDLAVYFYGGERAPTRTAEVLFGDVFRVGISARVRPQRASQPWAVYYYLYSQKSGQLRMIASVGLKSRNFDPHNEGLWVIEEPEPRTHIKVERQLLEEEFAQPGGYEIIPVLAFGQWHDPMQEVGYQALVSPIDYASLFSKDRAAFAGSPAALSVVQAVVRVQVPRFVYRDEIPRARVSLQVPDYAADYSTPGSFSVTPPSGGPSPDLDPESVGRVSVHEEDPTLVRIVFDGGTSLEGTYIFEASAEIPSLVLKDAQPKPQFAVFDYSKDANPEAGEEAGQGESLEDLLARMEALLSKAEALSQENKGLLKTVEDESRDVLRLIKGEKAALETLQSSFHGLLAAGVDTTQLLDTLTQTASATYGAGEDCARERSAAQDDTLTLCETTQAIQHTAVIRQLESLIQKARNAHAQVREHEQQFDARLSQARDATEQARQHQTGVKDFARALADLKNEFLKKNNTLDTVRNDVTRLEGQIADMESNAGAVRDLRAEADTLMGQAQDMCDLNPEKENKKVLGNISKVHRKILKIADRIDSLTADAQEKTASVGAPLAEYAGALSALQGEYEQKSAVLLAPAVLANIDAKVEDIRASFDAADLLTESVAQTVQQADTCLALAEDLFAQKTSPEAQVAQADCSAFAGTHPEWDASQNKVRCVCAAADVWVDEQNRCVNRIEHAVATTDCSRFPNTEPRWSEGDQKVLCFCLANFVWNGSQTACIDCSPYYQECQSALAGRDLNRAHMILQEARNCSWAPGLQAQIDEINRQQECRQLEGQIMALSSQVPFSVSMNQVTALMDRASALGCLLSDAAYQAATQAIQRQQEEDRRRQEQWAQEEERRRQEELVRQQQQQQAMMDMFGNILNGMNNTNNNTNPWETSGPTSPATPESSGPVTTTMSGCQGTITTNPSAGYAGVPFSITIRIPPPVNQYVARVTTNNPACHNCDASRVNATTWQRTLHFSGNGTFSLEFIAYDSQGKTICSGSTANLRAMGSKP
jgi:hypothetical protein